MWLEWKEAEECCNLMFLASWFRVLSRRWAHSSLWKEAFSSLYCIPTLAGAIDWFLSWGPYVTRVMAGTPFSKRVTAQKKGSRGRNRGEGKEGCENMCEGVCVRVCVRVFPPCYFPSLKECTIPSLEQGQTRNHARKKCTSHPNKEQFMTLCVCDYIM